MNSEDINVEDLRKTIHSVIDDMRQRPIPIGISNHHVHLCQKDMDRLFPGQELTVRKELKQPGQYAADQTLTLVGPKRSIENVRILGPVRSKTQIEISQTDARLMGIKAPIRLSGSGNLEKTPGMKLVSPHGEVELEQGVIIAMRHIHMSPLDALVYGVQHGENVTVELFGTSRRTVFKDVIIRMSSSMVLEMHIDTDEANAAEADNPDMYARLL